ncbi:MAG: putative bifunctional diguanylate cyclase/phosphodiesterase [Vitreoscilla sp.]
MSREPAEPTADLEAQLLLDTFRGIDLGVVWLDEQARIVLANEHFAGWARADVASLTGRPLSQLVDDLTPQRWEKIRADNAGAPDRLTMFATNGHGRVLEVRARPVMQHGQVLTALLLIPIADRVEAEGIDGLQREVLESVALGRPLRSVLDLLCRRVEALAPEVVCSVLLVEKNGTVTPIAGPSLPPAYVDALHGAAIGPRAGSCGTSAWRREPVEVTDIATDPLWADYRDLLQLLPMAACWSTPIIAGNGEVVATFALYYRKPGSAPPFHRRMVEACVPLCRVALQHEANRTEIERLAYFDPLTGLPNRRLFTDRARQTLQMAVRAQAPGALLLFDLDRFKTTNDSLGHSAGDDVLRETALRLQAEIGESATVARLGGDEFAAMLPRCSPVEAMHAAERLRHALAAPLRIAGMQIEVSTSIGIALFPQDGVELDRLVTNAEMAMYEVKRGGRGASRFFTSMMNDVVARRMQMESALRQALAARGLELHYQPKMYLDGSGCAGAEALVRWNDPVLGAVPPDRFIALAEECGLIGAIDAWVLETACAQLAAWQRDGVPVPNISVNVSPLRFHSDDVPAHVRRLLTLHGLAPSALVLEVTERVMLGDDERTRVDLRTLHEMGVRLSVDDFGTGYSSLGYLKRLPVSELKLDKSFVNDLEHEASDRALADAVMGIGRALGLQVVAEGVETPGQRDWLARAGCAVAQGFLFTRALPAAELVAWLERERGAWSMRRLAAVPGPHAGGGARAA